MTDQSVPLGAVSLSEAIAGLRRELLLAWQGSEGSYLRFRPSPVELTLQLGVTSEKGAHAGVTWWLIDAGAEASRELQAIQTIKLTLEPVVVNAQGNKVDFLVDDVEPTEHSGPPVGDRLADRE